MQFIPYSPTPRPVTVDGKPLKRPDGSIVLNTDLKVGEVFTISHDGIMKTVTLEPAGPI